jgi:hypothetical protein
MWLQDLVNKIDSDVLPNCVLSSVREREASIRKERDIRSTDNALEEGDHIKSSHNPITNKKKSG